MVHLLIPQLHFQTTSAANPLSAGNPFALKSSLIPPAPFRTGIKTFGLHRMVHDWTPESFEESMMPRRIQVKVTVNAYLGPVREKGPQDRIAPDQGDFRPTDWRDQSETIGRQNSRQQLGSDARPDQDRSRIGFF